MNQEPNHDLAVYLGWQGSPAGRASGTCSHTTTPSSTTARSTTRSEATWSISSPSPPPPRGSVASELDGRAEEAMTLAPGTRLGPYEILAPLDAGGMGEVYRARDTRVHEFKAIFVHGTGEGNVVQSGGDRTRHPRVRLTRLARGA